MTLPSTSTLSSPFPIPLSYGWILLTSSLICLHYSLHVILVEIIRRKYFNKKFFKDHFPDISVAPNGYPDMGTGIYAAKLDTQSWIAFNSAQRVHYNYLEALPTLLISILIGGIYYPRYTLVVAWLNIIGRTMYTYLYITGGPQSRGIGARITGNTLPMLVLGAVASAWKLSGGIGGLITVLHG
jgi:hypothetical protein